MKLNQEQFNQDEFNQNYSIKINLIEIKVNKTTKQSNEDKN